MSVFLGLDIGSSFLKGALLDLDARRLVAAERVAFPAFLEGLPEGHREVDPAAILGAVDALVERLTGRAPRRIDGVVLCGQMHGVILAGERGEAVSNYISWLDQRVSAGDLEELGRVVGERERLETGNEFRRGIGLSLLDWLRRHGALEGSRATPVSIADFVAGRLTGTVPVMDPTQAAAFGALRLGSLDWHPGILEGAGLAGLRWPEVRPSGSVAGLWRGVQCYASVGDQQCALAGALLGRGELSVNIGTGSQVAVMAAEQGAGSHQTRPYFGGAVLRTITHIPGGRHLSALVRLLTELGLAPGSEAAAFERIETAVEEVPATDLEAHIAFFPGPCGERGFLGNLHHGNLSIGHVFRAVFESMARNYRECARRVDPEVSAGRIVFSGGVARRFRVLRKMTEEALGLPGRLSPDAEDTLYGLLVLALAFSGRAESVARAQQMAADQEAVTSPRP